MSFTPTESGTFDVLYTIDETTQFCFRVTVTDENTDPKKIFRTDTAPALVDPFATALIAKYHSINNIG